MHRGDDGALGVNQKGFATGYGKRNEKNKQFNHKHNPKSGDYCDYCG